MPPHLLVLNMAPPTAWLQSLLCCPVCHSLVVYSRNFYLLCSALSKSFHHLHRRLPPGHCPAFGDPHLIGRDMTHARFFCWVSVSLRLGSTAFFILCITFFLTQVLAPAGAHNCLLGKFDPQNVLMHRAWGTLLNAWNDLSSRWLERTENS